MLGLSLSHKIVSCTFLLSNDHSLLITGHRNLFHVSAGSDISLHVLAFLFFHVVTSEGRYIHAQSGLFKLELHNKSVIIYETDLLYK